MNPNLPLIHLVSDQTMQNLLPILSLKPQIILQVRSSDVRFQRKSENLKSALAEVRKLDSYCDYDPEIQDCKIESKSPSIEQVRKFTGGLQASFGGAVFNLTGGTKLMSIGAYLTAQKENQPSFYCDTQSQQFLDQETGLNLFKEEAAPSLKEIAKRLNVRVALAAQGWEEGKQWTVDASNPELVPLSEIDHENIEKYGAEWISFRNQLRSHIRRGGEVTKEDYIRCQSEPLPLTNNEDFIRFFEQGVRVCLLRKTADRYYVQVGSEGATKTNLKSLNGLVRKLVGLLWELKVGALLQSESDYTDWISNFKPIGNSNSLDVGETDYLAYSPKDIGLTIISCKSSKPSLEHWESLLSRRERLGGIHTKTLLAIQSVEKNDKQIVLDRAKRFGYQVAFGSIHPESLNI